MITNAVDIKMCKNHQIFSQLWDYLQCIYYLNRLKWDNLQRHTKVALASFIDFLAKIKHEFHFLWTCLWDSEFYRMYDYYHQILFSKRMKWWKFEFLFLWNCIEWWNKRFNENWLSNWKIPKNVISNEFIRCLMKKPNIYVWNLRHWTCMHWAFSCTFKSMRKQIICKRKS